MENNKDLEEIKMQNHFIGTTQESIEIQQKLIFLVNQKNTDFIFYSSLLFTSFISFFVSIPAWHYFIYFAIATALGILVLWRRFSNDKKRRKKEMFEALVKSYIKNGLTNDQIKEHLLSDMMFY